MPSGGAAAAVADFRYSNALVRPPARVRAYSGFMASICGTLTGDFARGAASTIASIRAQHSAFPVANNVRNDRTRDMDQSKAATIYAGLPSMRLLVFG